MEQIAKILRVDLLRFKKFIEKMAAISGKQNVLFNIQEQNKTIIQQKLNELKIAKNTSAKMIFTALLEKIKTDERIIFPEFDKLSLTKVDTWEEIINKAKKLTGDRLGFFLKKEKAQEMLEKQPPINILKVLGYQNIKELLAKEEVEEIFASLRFLETKEWLNKVFFKSYEDLKIDDFEEREINFRILSPRWVQLSKEFIKKKYHNISHLKELGLIFIIPFGEDTAGELLRSLSLIMHYIFEIEFYSDLFKKFSFQPDNFALNFISSLKGDILEEPLKESIYPQWFIIQRYLAKENPNDWRLFEPHVNPEAIHWDKAEEALGLAFWQDLNWVGDYFGEELISFNLVDTAMSLVKAKEMIKYLYHHQEALWNKIFREFIGKEKMEELIKENWLKGYIVFEKNL